MTRVVNLRKESYDVYYIGRAGKGQDGYFGNPIIKDEECFVCGSKHELAGDTLDCYEVYLEFRCNTDDEFKRRLLELEGKNLGCFCKPGPCHGDSIIKWLESQKRAVLDELSSEAQKLKLSDGY